MLDINISKYNSIYLLPTIIQNLRDRKYKTINKAGSVTVKKEITRKVYKIFPYIISHYPTYVSSFILNRDVYCFIGYFILYVSDIIILSYFLAQI